MFTIPTLTTLDPLLLNRTQLGTCSQSVNGMENGGPAKEQTICG